MLFSPPGNRASFSTFWGDFLTKLHREAGEKGKNPLEKIQKIQLRRRPKLQSSDLEGPCNRSDADSKHTRMQVKEGGIREGRGRTKEG